MYFFETFLCVMSVGESLRDLNLYVTSLHSLMASGGKNLCPSLVLYLKFDCFPCILQSLKGIFRFIWLILVFLFCYQLHGSLGTK